MARRVHMSAGRLVISLPGYDAPNPPVEGLAFDSTWPFAGLVLGRGVYSDPAPPHPDTRYNTLTEATATRAIPVQGLRSGYSHLLVLFFEMSGARVVRQQIWRGSILDGATISVPRRYREFRSSSGSLNARGWERYTAPRGYLVIAG